MNRPQTALVEQGIEKNKDRDTKENIVLKRPAKSMVAFPLVLPAGRECGGTRRKCFVDGWLGPSAKACGG